MLMCNSSPATAGCMAEVAMSFAWDLIALTLLLQVPEQRRGKSPVQGGQDRGC